jgi:hypothetical protein
LVINKKCKPIDILLSLTESYIITALDESTNISVLCANNLLAADWLRILKCNFFLKRCWVCWLLLVLLLLEKRFGGRRWNWSVEFPCKTSLLIISTPLAKLRIILHHLSNFKTLQSSSKLEARSVYNSVAAFTILAVIES